MKTKLLLLLLGVVFTGFAVVRFVGEEKPSNENSKASTELVNISKQYSVKILFKNESKKIASWKSELNKEKIEFSKNNNLPNDKVIVNISNEFGTNITFDIDSINILSPYLNKLVIKCDTTIIESGLADRSCLVRVNKNITILKRSQNLVFEINRFDNHIRTYVLTDSLKKESLRIRYGSDSTYIITKDILKSEGYNDQDGYYLQYYDKDTLCLYGKNTVVTTEDNKDTNVRSIISIYKFYNGKCIEILPVVANQFIKDNYYVSNSGFMCSGDQYYFSLSKIQHDLDNKIIALFEKKENKLVFSHILSESLPHEYIDKKLFYTGSTFVEDYPYFTLHFSNVLYNIETHTSKIVSDLFQDEIKGNDILTFGKQRGVSDIKNDKKNNIYYIIVENGNYYYIKYDNEKSKVTIRKNLGVIANFSTSIGIDRVDYNYVYYCKDSFLIRKNIALF